MEKFLSIAVTAEQTQNTSATGILIVEQASTTTVTVLYKGGIQVTITHATAGAGDETARDGIQTAIAAALSTDWTKPVYSVPSSSLPYAVSGIAAAFIAQPTV